MVTKDRALSFAVGVFSTVALLACTAATFPYKYYPYDITNHNLVGATSADDLPDSVCEPRVDNQRPCMVVLTEAFEALKGDYLETKDKLNRCEQKQ